MCVHAHARACNWIHSWPSQVDRIYISAPDVLTLVDGAGGRTVTITKTGFPDAVVWNPWVTKAARMKDFGDEEYREVCEPQCEAKASDFILSNS
jgi:D-hexose-6-phosphate mutarotase